MAAAKRLGYKVRGIRYGNVVHSDVSDAMLRKPRRQDFRCIFRITVNGSIQDQNRTLLRRIRAPFYIFIDKPSIPSRQIGP